MKEAYVIGFDFGTDSVRSVLLNIKNGEIINRASTNYPRWKNREFCDSSINQFRQHPLDYLESFELCMKELLFSYKWLSAFVKGVAIATTGSTICPVDKRGMPLSLKRKYEYNPDAMFHLWKDHTAVEEAKEISAEFSSSKHQDYTKFQGEYSSEWYWAKILHTCRKNPEVYADAYSWIELCDWIPAVLTGNTDADLMYKSSCAAGHKAYWHSEFDGLPSLDVFENIDPILGLYAGRYRTKPKPAGSQVGSLTKEWADKFNFTCDVLIGGGSFDAHAGAVGAGIKQGTMVKSLGTSSVDMIISKDHGTLKNNGIKNYCGQAEDSIIPGYIGIETGQAAFGDIFAFIKNTLLWPIEDLIAESTEGSPELIKLRDEISKKVLPKLELHASELGQNMRITSVDWLNGRRYPFMNENAFAGVVGMTLDTSMPEIFYSLVLAAIFGAKRNLEHLKEVGFNIERMILVGGIAQKSQFIVSLLVDVLNLPTMICKEKEVCAKGAAIFAAVASGLFKTIPEAQKVLCENERTDVTPDTLKSDVYEKMYENYLSLGNYIDGLNPVN